MKKMHIFLLLLCVLFLIGNIPLPVNACEEEFEEEEESQACWYCNTGSLLPISVSKTSLPNGSYVVCKDYVNKTDPLYFLRTTTIYKCNYAPCGYTYSTTIDDPPQPLCPHK